LLEVVLALQIAAAARSDCAAVLERARGAFATRAFVEAARLFEQALPLCSERGPVLVSLAQTQLLSGNEVAAERSLRQAVEEDRANIAALYALGRVLYQQGRYSEAVKHLKRVVELEPDNYRAHDNLALCYDMLQQDSDALRHYFRALDLVKDAHRDYDWAYANLAEFFLKRDQFDKAFQLAAEAAQRNPNAARNFFLAGQSLVKIGKLEPSLRWLRQAVALDPSHAEAHYQLGQALRKLGRMEEAKAQLEEFRKLKARGPSAPDRPPRQ
jgi:tetratricopeptide (TPR) repeat protein